MRFILAVTWVFILVQVGTAGQAAAGAADKRLDIYWVDVEGGAATLMVTPAGESVLIDSGNPGRRDAERILQVATKVAGLRRIDFLVTTHYHGDHFGGAETLASLIPIRYVYDNAKWEGMPELPDKSYFEFPCEKRVQINPGDKLPLKQLDGPDAAPVTLTCLATRQQFVKPLAGTPDNSSICVDQRTKDRDGSDNANSVVLLLGCGPFRFFDGGDLTWNREADLVCPKNLIGKVDVYQTTHHGLDASNNPLVVRTLEPSVAIMNNGTTKGCMPEVFATLKETKSIQAIYQVHKNLRPDGATNNVVDEYIANIDKDCKANHIKLSVDPAGKSYTVSISANGHERVFQTRK